MATHCGATSWSGGIRATLRVRAPASTVWAERVADGGPAARAGLRVGDQVLSLDGVPIESMSEDELRSRVLGDVGSTVTLRIRRDTLERTLVIERGPLPQ
ncbi:MAG: PDZ domain-containing protein [Deltaproteobacteria bacterium]|nr:PDZ domain-containing protein [Deltaproteobacteria bacterium]